MRILANEEEVVVSGSDLIEGRPLCGTAVVASVRNKKEFPSATSSIYGMTTSRGVLRTEFGTFLLQPYMYFSVYGPCTFFSDAGVSIERKDYKCLNTIGGPAESTGRLRYIDGCTDTLLIGPPVIGDPCLNLLHFPKNVRQTMHTHPSLRCGITLAGEGRAMFPDGVAKLEPGSCWFLQTGGQHAFHTDNSELLVSAWHPDTDVGPSHNDHPMLNRTIVDGESAKYIDSIRTK